MCGLRLFFILFLSFSRIISFYAQNSFEKEFDNLRMLSEEAYKNGQLKLYKKYIDSAADLAKQNNLQNRYVLALMNKGIYFKNVNQIDSALIIYHSILDDLEEISDTSKMKIMIHANLVNTYSELGRFNEAKSLVIKVIKNALKHKNPDRVLSSAYNSLGIIYQNQKKYDSSLVYFNKAISLAQKANQIQYICQINNNIFDIYFDQNQFEKALSISEMTIQINPLDSSSTKLSSLYNKGLVLSKMKNYKESIFLMEKVFTISEDRNYYQLTLLAAKLLAINYEELNLPRKSLEFQKEYISRKEEYLASLSNAERVKAERDLFKKEELLTYRKREIQKSENLVLIIGSTLLALVLVLLYVLFQWKGKRKNFELQKEQMIRDQKILLSENKSLYFQLEKLYEPSDLDNNDNKSRLRLKKSLIPEPSRRKYINEILKFMEEEKPYLDCDLKQSEIAEKIGLTVHQLSEVLNQSLDYNFNNFINLYRVNDAKKLMRDPNYQDYKIMAIGYECGFKSKTSFYRAFKNLVGQTPFEYRKQST